MDGSHLTLVPPAPAASPKTVLYGAQASLAISSMHVVRHSTKALESGETWDRHMLATALRDAREALAEIEALLPTEPEAA